MNEMDGQEVFCGYFLKFNRCTETIQIREVNDVIILLFDLIRCEILRVDEKPRLGAQEVTPL